jgi:hypothetical protein
MWRTLFSRVSTIVNLELAADSFRAFAATNLAMSLARPTAASLCTCSIRVVGYSSTQPEVGGTFCSCRSFKSSASLTAGFRRRAVRVVPKPPRRPIQKRILVADAVCLTNAYLIQFRIHMLSSIELRIFKFLRTQQQQAGL